MSYYSFIFNLRYRNGNQLTTENKSRSDHICQEFNEQANEHFVTKPWVEYLITEVVLNCYLDIKMTSKNCQ